MPHDNLSKFLCLDPAYSHLLMLKKVAKALDELAKNQELMEGIFGAEEEGEEGQRLGTIGEDGDEELI